MRTFFKGRFVTILVLIATVILAGIAIFTAIRLYQLRQVAVAPNAPSQPRAATSCTSDADCSAGQSCIDTDGDGSFECSPEIVNEICGDSIDNNGNGQVDEGCTSSAGACTLSFTISAATASPTASPTSSSTASPTASPTAPPLGGPTSTPSPTKTATPAPTATPSLPDAGTGWPTIVGAGLGVILIVGALLLAI